MNIEGEFPLFSYWNFILTEILKENDGYMDIKSLNLLEEGYLCNL